MLKRNRYIVVALLCILIPLLETLGEGTLWGLHYESPRAMDTLGDIVRLVKLLSIVAGLYLLVKNRSIIAEAFHSKVLKITFFSVFYLLSWVQIPTLLLGNLFFGIMAPKDYIHYEQSAGQDSFYVYTADPGAMGTAYHHVYLKCPLPFNRYELIKVGKTRWLKVFDIKRGDNSVALISKGTTDGSHKVYRLSMENVSCGES